MKQHPDTPIAMAIGTSVYDDDVLINMKPGGTQSYGKLSIHLPTTLECTHSHSRCRT